MLSVLLGLIIAWIILFFIGPRPAVSYYVQAPVQPTDLDKIMEAVGLKPSMMPVESVAEMAIMSPAPAPVPSDLYDQDTMPIQPFASPAPSPADLS